jgi:Major Facilitator Superfamily
VEKLAVNVVELTGSHGLQPSDVEIRRDSTRIRGTSAIACTIDDESLRRTEDPVDKKWWTLVAVCAGMFMLLLDVTIVIVAQPAIQAGLHASFSDVQWTLDAYALTLAALLLTSGSLADRYGRKLLFGIGLTVFTLGSLLCGVAVTPLMLILSRSGQGIGGAMMFATSLALLGNSFRGRERGVAFGVWGAVVGIATALGAWRDHHDGVELARHLPRQHPDRRVRAGGDDLADG